MGFEVGCIDHHGPFLAMIRLTPPLNISEDDLDFAVGVLDRMLKIADRAAEV